MVEKNLHLESYGQVLIQSYKLIYYTILPSAGKWHNYTVAIRNVKFNQLYKMQLIDLIAVDKQTFVQQCF